ncbi:MAG: PfkB family carbohydrate kinase [Actinomycetota bacterium]|nr:PfkB family carbohydrate kinase [Actinomycetota bacterium]
MARHPAVGETILGEALAVTPGGKGLNQAVAAAAAMGSEEGTVHLHGAVGADDAGRWLIAFAAGCGVGVDHVRVVEGGRTGSAWITVADDGANSVIVDPGANAATRFGLGADQLSELDVVVAQLEVPEAAVASLLQAARTAGACSLFNPSPVGVGRHLVPHASIVVCNEHELAELSGPALVGGHRTETVERRAAGMRHPDQTVVVTLGADGAVAVGPDGTDVVAGIPMEAVDTTGAGDCLLGVLAGSLARGLRLPDALRRANRAAAHSVTQAGAALAIPRADEMDRPPVGRDLDPAHPPPTVQW